MFIEALGLYSLLKKWKENPSATKRDIGLFSNYLEDKPENNRSFSEEEIKYLKDSFWRVSPTAFYEMFGDDRQNRKICLKCSRVYVEDHCPHH